VPYWSLIHRRSAAGLAVGEDRADAVGSVQDVREAQELAGDNREGKQRSQARSAAERARDSAIHLERIRAMLKASDKARVSAVKRVKQD
jgi:hypothetical protein